MNKLKTFFSAFVAAMLCSCGHNAIQFYKGLTFDAGFDPEHLSARVSVGYGDLLSVAARDNLEIELATDVEGGQEQSAAEVKTGSKLKVKIGRQMNGATVDAIEAGATAEQLRALFNPSPASPSTNQDSSGSTM